VEEFWQDIRYDKVKKEKYFLRRRWLS